MRTGAGARAAWIIIALFGIGLASHLAKADGFSRISRGDVHILR